MSSIHQKVPVKSNSPYCMAKASMEMFGKVASLEFSKDNIRVNTIAPGAIRTDMNREIIKDMGEENFNEWIPLGRVGETSEIFGPTLFLASSASSYVTGTTLYVDGGYMQNLLRY
jgi:gluconate 5-dehydrogenase